MEIKLHVGGVPEVGRQVYYAEDFTEGFVEGYVEEGWDEEEGEHFLFMTTPIGGYTLYPDKLTLFWSYVDELPWEFTPPQWESEQDQVDMLSGVCLVQDGRRVSVYELQAYHDRLAADRAAVEHRET